MATEQLLLASVGDSDGWILAAGASKVTACQAPDDEATSYIRSGTSTGTVQLFYLMSPVQLREGDTINSVSIRIRHRRAGTPAGSVQSMLVTPDGSLYGAEVGTGAGFADRTDLFSLNPLGDAWTMADLEALQAGLRNTLSREVHCTTVAVVVDYSPYVPAASVLVGAGLLASDGLEVGVQSPPPERIIPAAIEVLAATGLGVWAEPGGVLALAVLGELSVLGLAASVARQAPGEYVPVGVGGLASGGLAARALPGGVAAGLLLGGAGLIGQAAGVVCGVAGQVAVVGLGSLQGDGLAVLVVPAGDRLVLIVLGPGQVEGLPGRVRLAGRVKAWAAVWRMVIRR
jgi:hypothetical protein